MHRWLQLHPQHRGLLGTHIQLIAQLIGVAFTAQGAAGGSNVWQVRPCAPMLQVVSVQALRWALCVRKGAMVRRGSHKSPAHGRKGNLFWLGTSAGKQLSTSTQVCLEKVQGGRNAKIMKHSC